MTDEELIQEILDGNDEAMKELHGRHVQSVFQYLYIQMSDYHDAQELLQDVMYKAARRLATFKGDSAFKTWLFAIAKHAVIDYYRTRGKRRRTTAVDNTVMDAVGDLKESAEQTVIRQMETESVMQTIRQLPQTYRDVLHLRFIEGFSIKETAKVMGKTSMSVKALQKRARAELVNRIGNEVTAYE
ncbi:RNA polymerase sigma factor [Salisediminibacterium selenitireducens]|uniref:RNA polymerase, sigma-24 subunit, ECF subfamily n=1 Tax=Bacillus selenitireducens (strain ATCC 700615 / DSM 15326 / MLS10) TaxID=439292 RepID=D6XVY8_BACIE|nr:RNA polymerase sigma factor [Salisediminibacterium selenitireducens]ADH97761.1 RNA polymerase, sigma-24 subunit, ECF subfamily [[Bacillus] selenitireducens MLS10]